MVESSGTVRSTVPSATIGGAGDAPLMLSVSGCRGIFGKTMTPEVTARFAAVLGAFVRERTAPREGRRPLVVLGRDGRAGGQILARAAGAGLAAAGCDVLDLDVAMTATVGVMVDARNAAAGVVVTASHNPQEWNGLKAITNGTAGTGGEHRAANASAPNKAMADELIARYRHACSHGVPGVGVSEVGSIAEAAPGGLGLTGEGDTIHLEKVREALKLIGAHDDRRSVAVKAVLDSVNASGRIGGREILGARLVQHLGAGDSGYFPHAPEPTAENLGGLCRAVSEKRADVGFAQDPDADRLAVVDERGQYIGEEYTLVLAAEAILGSGRVKELLAAIGASESVICTNLSTSRMIEDVASRHGARVIRTAVGEANGVDAMKRHRAIMGGEGNGGVIWPLVTYIRDSISGMGLVLALLARTGKSLSELVGEMPRYAIVKRKVDLAAQAMAVPAVEAVARAFAADRVDRQDGVRVDFDDRRAWLHVRASNTEPIMRLIAEAPTKADAERILDDAARVIAQGRALE